VKSEIEDALRHRAVAGKAMEDAADLVRGFLGENSKRILFGFARVDHDWQPTLFRKSNLLAKHLLLHLARRKVVVVIEPDLSEPSSQKLRVDDGSRGCRGVRGIVGELARRMRMNADRKSDSRPLSGEIACLRDLRLVIRRENHERMRDTRGFRATDNVGEIRGKFWTRNVAVRVNYRTRAPGGTGSSKLTRIGLPSPTLAASTMPFDSMPINLAGLRLKTIAIVRPRSCSG